MVDLVGAPYENRTRVSALRGRTVSFCFNRLRGVCVKCVSKLAAILPPFDDDHTIATGP